jgi:hypothetical protein
MEQFMSPEGCFKRECEIAIFSKRKTTEKLLYWKSTLEQLKFCTVFIKYE